MLGSHTTNLHHVEGIEASDIQINHLDTSDIPYFTRKLTIRTKFNGAIQFTLFADNMHDLQIHESQPALASAIGDDPFA